MTSSTSEALVPPDLEAAVVAHLSPLLAAPVSTRVPNPTPPAWVRITRAGGQDRNLVQTDIRLLVECWAADEGAAFELARNVYAQLWAVQRSEVEGVVVMGIRFTEPVNFPDPNRPEQHRYQFIATCIASLQRLAV